MLNNVADNKFSNFIVSRIYVTFKKYNTKFSNDNLN